MVNGLPMAAFALPSRDSARGAVGLLQGVGEQIVVFTEFNQVKVAGFPCVITGRAGALREHG